MQRYFGTIIPSDRKGYPLILPPLGTIHVWRHQYLTCRSCKSWDACGSCIVQQGPKLNHKCPQSSDPTLVLDSVYPKDDSWDAEQTVLLAHRLVPSQKPQTFVLATTNWTAKDAEDMSIKRGDRLLVTTIRADGWYVARNDWMGQSGMFPSNFVIIDEPAVKTAQQHCWLADDDFSSAQSQDRAVSIQPGEPSPEMKLQHREKKMDLWGNALKFGTVVLEVMANS
jgi:SH3 domain